MCGACSALWEQKHLQCRFWKPQGRRHLEILDIDGRVVHRV